MYGATSVEALQPLLCRASRRSQLEFASDTLWRALHAHATDELASPPLPEEKLCFGGWNDTVQWKFSKVVDTFRKVREHLETSANGGGSLYVDKVHRRPCVLIVEVAVEVLVVNRLQDLACTRHPSQPRLPQAQVPVLIVRYATPRRPCFVDGLFLEAVDGVNPPHEVTHVRFVGEKLLGLAVDALYRSISLLVLWRLYTHGRQ